VATAGLKLIPIDAKIFPSLFVFSGYKRASSQRLPETDGEVPHWQDPIPSPEGGLGENDQ
jgi:hypothetical protein